MWVLASHLPPDSSLMLAVTNGDSAWRLEPMLLAAAVDQLAVANWQRQGKASAPRPKPIQRPGVKDNRRVVAKGGLPRDQLDRLLEQHLGRERR